MTSLAYSFPMDKSPIESILFGRKILISQPIFNFLWHFLRLLGCRRIVKFHFAGGVSGQGVMQKDSFQMMV